jgi:hypothetical protein
MIQYELADLGASRYRYTYTVTHDGSLADPLRGFNVLFDPALFDEASLTITTLPPLADEWDQLLLASGLLVPAAFDALALGSGIPAGAFVSGFGVEFLWLGAGVPGSQPFEIFDPISFEVLGSGTTVLVPEPGTVALLLLGVTVVAGARRIDGSA